MASSARIRRWCFTCISTMRAGMSIGWFINPDVPDRPVPMPVRMTNIVDVLNSAIGQDRVLAGVAIGQKYISDCSRIGTVRPLAVVLPDSTNEVSTVLQV